MYYFFLLWECTKNFVSGTEQETREELYLFVEVYNTTHSFWIFLLFGTVAIQAPTLAASKSSFLSKMKTSLIRFVSSPLSAPS